MKVHVGADVNSGLMHTVSVTPANGSDINQLPHRVREDDRAVFGDKGYVNKKLKGLVRKAGLFWDVSLKASKQHPLTEAKKRFNHKMSSIGPRSYRRLISPGISGLRPGARSACSRSHAGGRPRSQPR